MRTNRIINIFDRKIGFIKQSRQENWRKLVEILEISSSENLGCYKKNLQFYHCFIRKVYIKNFIRKFMARGVLRFDSNSDLL